MIDTQISYFMPLETKELENISGGGGNLAYDVGYYIGKKYKDLYCYRHGYHIRNNRCHGGGGRKF